MKNTLSGNQGKGFMKIIVASDTDTVVGVHLIGPETAEIIQVKPCSLACTVPLRCMSLACCRDALPVYASQEAFQKLAHQLFDCE